MLILGICRGVVILMSVLSWLGLAAVLNYLLSLGLFPDMLLLDQNDRWMGQLRRIVMTDRATQFGIQMGVVIYARVFY